MGIAVIRRLPVDPLIVSQVVAGAGNLSTRIAPQKAGDIRCLRTDDNKILRVLRQQHGQAGDGQCRVFLGAQAGNSPIGSEYSAWHPVARNAGGRGVVEIHEERPSARGKLAQVQFHLCEQVVVAAVEALGCPDRIVEVGEGEVVGEAAVQVVHQHWSTRSRIHGDGKTVGGAQHWRPVVGHPNLNGVDAGCLR